MMLYDVEVAPTLNQRVVGSSPTAPTNDNNGLAKSS